MALEAVHTHTQHVFTELKRVGGLIVPPPNVLTLSVKEIANKKGSNSNSKFTNIGYGRLTPF